MSTRASRLSIIPVEERRRIKRDGWFRWFFYRARGDSPALRLGIHIALIVLCLIALYPLVRIIGISVRPGHRLLTTDLALFPADATIEHYRNVLFNRDFLLWIWNSLLITLSTATLGIIIAATGAYAFSRWNFPGKKTGLVFLLATQMIPAAMMMVPIYILAIQLDLINTWIGLVVAWSVQTVPFSTWILKGYYDTIPFELEQAAMVDGATRIGAFLRIILPLAVPAMAIAFLFNFMHAWNDYLLARIMLQSRSMYTWTLGLHRMQGQFHTQWGEFSAAAVMVSIPATALFLFSSKWLISGLTLGSVKG